MIDWHTHILPMMDDGSRSVAESIAMLDAMRDQGVTHVVATPHFLANEESVESFLARRDHSYAELREAIGTDYPQILCGAEVKYYPGISRMDGLKELTVAGTRILMLEMPIAKWTEYTVKELIEISVTRGVTLVLAHVERYLWLQSAQTIKSLCDNGILMQVNANSLMRIGLRRRVLGLVDNGIAQLIGSDCHGSVTRPPNLGQAYDVLTKKLGQSYVSKIKEFGHRTLEYR